WVKPGFGLKGKKLRIEEWPAPVFVAKERRARDSARAYELAEQMPLRLRTVLRRSLQGFGEATTERVDLVQSGRLVDHVAKGTMGLPPMNLPPTNACGTVGQWLALRRI